MPGYELFTVILSITTKCGLKPEYMNTEVAAERLLIVNGNAPCEPAARNPTGNQNAERGETGGSPPPEPGAETAFPSRVTEVCASARPFNVAPVCIAIFV
jgi:hypothetical protein